MESLFIIVSEGAWFPLEDPVPTGAYGIDWCVMRAESGHDALRQAPGSVTGSLPISGDAETKCLTEPEARAAFAAL